MTQNQFEKEYSEQGFWEKLKNYAQVAGRKVLEPALQMYFSARDADTPAWAKATIYSALGYFIVPLDAIPDFTPLTGYADDLGVLVAALATVAAHIKPEHKSQVQDKMIQWFGPSEKE